MPHQGLDVVSRDGALELVEHRGASRAIAAKMLTGNGAGALLPLIPGYGTLAQMTASTDLCILDNVGLCWITPTGQEFIVAASPVDGVTPYWKPRSGRQTIYQRCGSIAAPLATLTGVTSGSFTIPGGNPSIPANLLLAGVSHVRVFGHFRRSGATATATIALRLGTAGGATDNALWALSLAATTDLSARPDTFAEVATATTYCALNWTTTNGTSAAAAADRTTQFNTASVNIISADLASANVADTFQLIALGIEVLG